MISEKSFLGAVAQAYVSKCADLSDLCFVFPNKRSGTFFLKEMSRELGDRTILAPEVLEVSDFAARVSGVEVATRIDLLFRLYRVYRGLCGLAPGLSTEEDLLDFDRFAPWGETLLSDFSEVDRYLADADAVFENVRDYREISSKFLTEEQCDIIERYFGYRPSSSEVAGFWNTVGSADEEKTRLKQKFLELWRLLPELYHALKKNLDEASLQLPGSVFANALDTVRREGRNALPWKRIVAVGFNSLSTAEAELFSELRKLDSDDDDDYAEFFWDATGPILAQTSDSDSKGGETTRAGGMMASLKRNMRNFPMPGWALRFIAMASADSLPAKISFAASPSNSVQTKIAAMQVSEWISESGNDKISNARTAVVIPDENLLLPLIHSLPEELESVNLTMGYSMRFTSIASFMHHLRNLHAHRRVWQGREGFWYQDFSRFMTHPILHAIVGSTLASEIKSDVAQRHMRVVSADWIRSKSEKLADILAMPPGKPAAIETIDYIRHVLDVADAALAGEGEVTAAINSKIERAQILHYRQALTRLQISLEHHDIKMGAGSVFHLVDRLLAGETVTFEGQPLKGLQVMGLLETRALDFDRIVILSMNDKVMPGRSRGRTFIPEALRHGYGLPSAFAGEEQYAYYFYRLLSRADEVTLVYDARAGEGMRSGGKSRFLMQLEMLYARGSVTEKTYSFGLVTRDEVENVVSKTPNVMKLLQSYCEPGGKNLSASALMDYCACQVKFYYKHLLGIRDELIATDYIDALSQGNIVHDIMLRLYFPKELRREYLDSPLVLKREALEALLADPCRIEREVRRAINRIHFKLEGEEADRELSGSIEMTSRYISSMVRTLISRDLQRAPIELVGGELKGVTRWKIGNAPEVNVSYSFDRVEISGGMMRIIDYKTGHATLKAPNVEGIFSGSSDSKYMLQGLIYANLLEKDVHDAQKPLADNIGVMVLDANSRMPDTEVLPEVGKNSLSGHREVKEEFLGCLERTISDIFDETIDFRGASDVSTCRNCNLRYLCGCD